MMPTERKERILEILQADGRVLVDRLSDRLGCSRETVRRDLKSLSLQGLVRKFHGGAELPPVDGEHPFRLRMSENARAKRIIGERAARLFHSGDSLFVDTGTTTIYFARALARRGAFSVITNSTIIADTFAQREGEHSVFLIGGQYDGEAAEALGSIAVEQVRIFRAAHVVLTVAAVDARFGVTDYSLEESQVARAMLAQAQQRTIIVDSSKFARTALFEVCPVDGFDRMVTEAPPPPPLQRALRAAGVEVIVAEDGLARPEARRDE